MRKRYQRSATMQNKLNLLKENRAKDATKLKDMLESKTTTLNSFDIDVPNDLDDEANIAPFVREAQNTISNKYIDAAGKVTEAQETEAKTRQAISQQQGTNTSLIQSRNALQQRKTALCQADKSVGKIKALIPVLADNGFGFEDFVIEKNDPQIMLDTLDEHLKQLDDNSPEQMPPESVAKLMRKIKKLVSAGFAGFAISPISSALCICVIVFLPFIVRFCAPDAGFMCRERSDSRRLIIENALAVVVILVAVTITKYLWTPSLSSQIQIRRLFSKLATTRTSKSTAAM